MTDARIAMKAAIQPKQIEITEQFHQALDLMENTRQNVFVTGKAGTGKSTLLDYFRNTTKKRVVILAPTGVAALNVEGQTIHSFFHFRPDITLAAVKRATGPDRNLYKMVDTIVIDEISMVRADLLDCVEKFLRVNGPRRGRPFGDVQMIFFGDLYQLPPVVTGKEKGSFRTQYQSPYFFDAHSFDHLQMVFVELEKVYRQKDQQFIDLLNAIRNNSVTPQQIERLNQRVDSSFDPPADDFFIQLTTTNAMAAAINEKELAQLKTKQYRYAGQITGKFEERYLPTDIDLKVKAGAHVMMVNNDSGHRWVNGTVGRIADIQKGGDSDIIVVERSDGKQVEVVPYTWKIYRLYYDSGRGSLESESIGSFIQYPLRLAWAVTIHKSQGKTFDKVVIDIGGGTFAHGQMYVALSRCTSLDGMVLRKPLQKRHVFMDWRVVRFLTSYQYRLSEKHCSLEEKRKRIEEAIKNRLRLRMVYLKANDEKSQRIVIPKRIGTMTYLGRSYLGMEAFCLSRQADRVFRIDRILELTEAE